MKQILLVVPLLVTVAVAQYQYKDEYSSYQKSGISQRLRRGINKRQQPTVDNGATLDLRAMIKKVCESNGHPEAVLTVETAMQQFQSCMQVVLSSQPRPQDTSNADTQMRAGVRLGCRIAPEVGNCLVTLVNSTKTCMSPTVQRNLQMANTTHSTISYLCDNDAARTFAFIENGGVQCLRSQQNQIQQCVSSDESEDSSNIQDSSEMQSSICRESAEFTTCFESKLRSCENSEAVVTFFQGLLDVLAASSPCKKPS